jgi:membrane associated rhomboid family serine protease
MGLYEEIRNLHTAWNSQPENSAFMPQAEAYLQQVRDLYTAGGSLGASGAVYGLLAGAAYLFPNDEVYFNFFIPLKMKWLVLLYGIATISGIYNNMSDGIAHYAHLGGGIAGFCLVYFVYKRNRQNFY